MKNSFKRLFFGSPPSLNVAMAKHERLHQSGKKSSSTRTKIACKRYIVDSVRACFLITLLIAETLGSLGTAFADTILPVNTIPTGLNVINVEFILMLPF